LGKSGFKLLTREQSEISQKAIKAKYAVIGSYAFTTTQVIVFARLINIVDGTIRSSNTISFPISEELKRLEGINEKKNVLEIY
jgi:TolB-like protein